MIILNNDTHITNSLITDYLDGLQKSDSFTFHVLERIGEKLPAVCTIAQRLDTHQVFRGERLAMHVSRSIWSDDNEYWLSYRVGHQVGMNLSNSEHTLTVMRLLGITVTFEKSWIVVVDGTKSLSISTEEIPLNEALLLGLVVLAGGLDGETLVGSDSLAHVVCNRLVDADSASHRIYRTLFGHMEAARGISIQPYDSKMASGTICTTADDKFAVATKYISHDGDSYYPTTIDLSNSRHAVMVATHFGIDLNVTDTTVTIVADGHASWVEFDDHKQFTTGQLICAMIVAAIEFLIV